MSISSLDKETIVRQMAALIESPNEKDPIEDISFRLGYILAEVNNAGLNAQELLALSNALLRCGSRYKDNLVILVQVNVVSSKVTDVLMNQKHMRLS